MIVLVVTIDGIRSMLNMHNPQELSDESILIAIQRANEYISALARRSVIEPSIIDVAKRNYAAYLAYQTYSDRVVNELPGSVNAEGIWTPTGEVIMRDVHQKLQHLRATALDSIRMIVAYGTAGRIVRPGFLLF